MTLGEDYPNQQKRCRELLILYEQIGSDGIFGAAVIRQTLKEADEAAISEDLPRMIRAYEDMKARE